MLYALIIVVIIQVYLYRIGLLFGHLRQKITTRYIIIYPRNKKPLKVKIQSYKYIIQPPIYKNVCSRWKYVLVNVCSYTLYTICQIATKSCWNFQKRKNEILNTLGGVAGVYKKVRLVGRKKFWDRFLPRNIFEKFRKGKNKISRF